MTKILVAEDELAIVFRQAGVAHEARSPQAILPFRLALGLLVGTIGLLAWDLRRSRHVTGFPV